jgi:protease I
MLNKKRIAIFIAPKFHEKEVTVPRDFLVSLKADVDLIGLDEKKVAGKADKLTLLPNKAIKHIKVKDYDAVIIPGGGAPERIRLDKSALSIVRDFWHTGKPIAAICHGPQVLISAGVLDGVTLTSYIGIRDDVENSGGKWVDEQVVIDGQLITSRTPDDLDVFNDAILTALTTGFLPPKEEEMDVLSALETAISREKGAQEFYAGVAKIISIKKVQNKFKYLSTVEETHYDQLFDMFVKLSDGKQPKIDIKAVSEIGQHKVEKSISTDEAIELAMRAEQKAYEFYRNAALKSNSKAAKDMFEYLAAEELEHKRLFSMDKASQSGGMGHFQWATHFDIPPGTDDLW